MSTAEASAERRRKAYFSGAMMETPIIFGDQLDAGTVIEGPAIIEEATFTLVINRGANARVSAGGRYVLTPPEESEI